MIYAVSILVLVLIFTTATITPINMGILAFAGAFVVGGWVSGIPIEDITDAFPGDIFLIVGGITLLFAIAKANGSIDLIIASSLKLVRGKPWAIVFMMFFMSGMLMALGSVMAAGMLAPIAMSIAAKERINPLLMGMAINHGALSCAFSPITIYGAFVNGLMNTAGYPTNPLVLFVVPFALNLLFFVVLFAIFGRDLFGRSSAESGPADGSAGPSLTRPDRTGGGVEILPAAALTADDVEPVQLDRIKVATFLGIAVLVLGSVFFQIDVGVSAVTISAVLLLLAPKDNPKIVGNIAWPAVVLVCGMLTYMAVLTQNGTLDYLGEAASALGSPLLTALILCYAVGIISAFGSSIGTLGIALPLAAPMLAMGELGALGFVVALAFSATVVDVSPFATNGSIVVAEAQVDDKPRFQRQMLAYCGVVVLLAPVLAWGLIIVPTSL